MNIFRTAWLGVFPAMHERNYRLFFYGQLISWSGNWLQIATLGWLVKTVLHAPASQVALVAALPQVVAAAGAFWLGFITDRFDERRLLYVTQSIQMIQAFVLGWLTLTHRITFAWVEVLVVVMGVSNALDRPTTHTFIMRIARKHLRSAVAMNGSLIMAGASIGGLLASILIPLVGIGGAFIANAVSFIAIFWTLALMKLPLVKKDAPQHAVAAIISGWRYLWNEKSLLFYILLNGIVVVLGFSYRAIFPVITTEIFHAGSSVNGSLYACAGIGAFVGTCLVSSLQKELGKETKLFQWFVTGGMLVSGLSLVLFAVTRSLWADLLFLAISSMGVIMASSTLRGSIQHHIQEEKRGRVMGFVFAVFLGGVALGSWLAGVVATHVGSLKTIVLAGVISTLVGVLLYFKRNVVFIRRDHMIAAASPIAVV